jgi:hypothetical protein
VRTGHGGDHPRKRSGCIYDDLRFQLQGRPVDNRDDTGQQAVPMRQHPGNAMTKKDGPSRLGDPSRQGVQQLE